MDIRLTQTQPLQPVRLLELPPELLDQLESDHPPQCVSSALSPLSLSSLSSLLSLSLCLSSLAALAGADAGPPRLFLKSSAPTSTTSHSSSSTTTTTTSASASTSTASASSRPGTDFVNLCTPTETFSLRQVNSSNSVFLLKPRGEADTATAALAAAPADSTTLTAIAQCKSTLEAQAMASSDSALAPLLAALAVYDESDIRIDDRTEEDDHPLSPSEIVHERSKVFADIPFSLAECERAWKHICAFVHKNKESGAIGCHRPSARAKLMAWEKIVEGATLHGIDLGKQFLVEDLWSAVIEEAEHTVIDEYPFPRSLFDAIVRRLVDNSPIDGDLKCTYALRLAFFPLTFLPPLTKSDDTNFTANYRGESRSTHNRPMDRRAHPRVIQRHPQGRSQRRYLLQ